MVQAHAHLGYAPRGVGLLYAALWFEQGADIYGWFIGDASGESRAAYFVLRNHYAHTSAEFMRSVQDDIYGPWVEVTASGEMPLAHAPPVPEALCHELARLQDQFVRHWLFVRDDPTATAQVSALQARELAVRAINPRADRLGKFHIGAAVWRYDAPGADLRVLELLSRRWPLDYRVEP